MEEQVTNVSVQTSYCLDLICFIDLLFQETPRFVDEQTKYWESVVSDESIQLLKSARRLLAKDETFISTLGPLILLDDDFNNLLVIELLQAPRYLLSKCKSSVYLSDKHPGYRKTMLKKGERLLRGITPMIECLERCKFKNYWIQNRLPMINSQVKALETSFEQSRLDHRLKQWRVSPLMNAKLYVLSYYTENTAKQTLPINAQFVTLTAQPQDVALAFVLLHLDFLDHISLKKPYRSFKKEQTLKKHYEMVKTEYEDFEAYMDALLTLSLTGIILSEAGYLMQPYEYLARYQFGTHKFSVILFEYMQFTPRQPNESLANYFKTMYKQVSSDKLTEQFVSIMTKK